MEYNVDSVTAPERFRESATFTVEDTIDFTQAECKPSKYGYRFMGWYSDSDYEYAINAISHRIGNLTIYGKFERVNITVKFAENEYRQETIQYGTPAYGSNGYLTNKIPTKDGYKFAGWYIDKELTKKVPARLEGDPDAAVAITFYAKWEQDYTAVWWGIFIGLMSATIILFIIWFLAGRPRVYSS